MRFSRNPHVTRALAEVIGYVRELNEGVKRMFEEMDRFGLRPPTLSVTEGGVRVTLFKQPDEARRLRAEQVAANLTLLDKRVGEASLRTLLNALLQRTSVPTRDVADLLQDVLYSKAT